MAAQAAAAAAASNTTHHPVSATDPNASQKVFSFVPIPGVNHKKRPRRKYHEVERLYHCNYPGCTKAYGTLNHLNAHVSMQSHGPKRLPSEFKELRKQWRKQKREREATRQQQQENAAAAVAANNTQYHHHQAAAAAAAPPPPPPFLPSHSSTPSYLPWQHQQGYPGPPHQQAEFADLATLPGAPPF
ncbi:hypothetical protein BJV82DRAFT_516651 [Fennellomyces sp. T-0311]|nr:hypothetical protein BJV82DRAFT_516651 [Fennellomyces sp. T-0311]